MTKMFGNKRDVYTFKEDKPKPKKNTKITTEEKSDKTSPQTLPKEPPIDKEPTVYPQEKEIASHENLKKFFYKEKSENEENLQENEIEDYDDEPASKPKKEKKIKAVKPPKEKTIFLKDKKKIGLALIAVSLLVILVVSPTLNMMTSAEMTTAVIALVDIPKGTKIDSKMFDVKDVAKSALLPIHINSENLVLDKYAKTDIAKNEMLSTPKLADTLPFDNSYLYTLPIDKKAISIAIPNLSSGLSSKLQGGDIITIYANISDSEKEKSDYTAILPPELGHVKVLAVTNAEAFDLSATPEKSVLESPLANTIILEVNDIQAMSLVGLQANGQIHVALVSRGDDEKANMLLQLQETYFLEEEPQEEPAKEETNE